MSVKLISVLSSKRSKGIVTANLLVDYGSGVKEIIEVFDERVWDGAVSGGSYTV